MSRALAAPIPLRVAERVAKRLAEELSLACHRIEVAGGVRRLRPMVSDLDLVVIPKIERGDAAPAQDLFGEGPRTAPPERNLLWAAIDRMGLRCTKRGPLMRQLVVRLEEDGRELAVDLFTADAVNWGYLLLVRTGSGEFSREIVSRLARAKRPAFDGYVRDAGQTRPLSIGPTGFPQWAEPVKAAMPIIPTPEEKDVFRLACSGWTPPAERSWE